MIFINESIFLEKKFNNSIVFVWSQYDGRNIDKEQLAEVPSKTKDAKLKIVGGDFIWILTTRSCSIVKILNLLYHTFMYSLVILLSSIYPFTQCHSLLVTIICISY